MRTTFSSQRGSMLLEALIAILIFSLGILAIVGLQAGAIKMSSDAKYRTDATMLANRIIGQMWVDNRTPGTLQTRYAGSLGSGGAAYNVWAADVVGSLPGISGVPTNQPAVTVAPNPVSGVTVTVTINWQVPGEAKHKVVATEQII